jgi:hypothetical protein
MDSVDAFGDLPTETWERPDFCHECGAAFPWADRQARIYELQNKLDREQLDEGTRLKVREQLDALADPDLNEEEAVRRWDRVHELAPGLWERGQGIITDLATAYMKTKLGL